MSDHISDDFVVKAVIKALAKNARKTYGRILYLNFYLEYRWVRTNFPSWLKLGYYPQWRNK